LQKSNFFYAKDGNYDRFGFDSIIYYRILSPKDKYCQIDMMGIYELSEKLVCQ